MLGVQMPHHARRAFEPCEAREDEAKPGLHLQVGVLDDDLARHAHQPHRQGEREVAARCFGQQARGQPAADRVQLQFGDRALEPQEQTAVGSSGIVDPVPVGDQASSQSADVQQRIPIRAVPGEPGHVDRQHKADLAEPHAGGQFLEAFAPCRGRTAQAEVGVDDVDVGGVPAQLTCALAERVLQPQAFHVAYHLSGRGLADVDNRPARQMRRRDKFGLHDASPPEPRRRPR